MVVRPAVATEVATAEHLAEGDVKSTFPTFVSPSLYTYQDQSSCDLTFFSSFRTL